MLNKRPSQRITLKLLSCVILGLSLFVFFWEKYDTAQDEQEVRTNAEVIARSVWDLDTSGSEVFLNLMMEHQNLTNIIIFTYSGETFLEITKKEHSFLSQCLHAFGLSPESKFESDIFYRGNVIGRIEEVHRNDNIYLYFYVFLLLMLLAGVTQLYIRNVEARTLLESRVRERTADLNQIKERLTVTLRSIGDGVIATNVKGNIVLINSIAEQLTGWKNEKAMGKPLVEIFHIQSEKAKEECLNPDAKIVETGAGINLPDYTILTAKDGAEYSITVSVAPIRDQNNTTIGDVLVFRDVTAELQREKEQSTAEKLKLQIFGIAEKLKL